MNIPRGIHVPMLYVVIAVLGMLFLARSCDSPDPPVYDKVQVDSSAIVRQEPRARLSTLDNVTTQTVKPTVVATAKHAAAGDVANYCRAAGWVIPTSPSERHTEISDTGARAGVAVPADSALSPAHSDQPATPAVLLLRSELTQPGWFFRRTHVRYVGPLSSSDLRAVDYNVWPGWAARVDGDSVVVHSPRFGWWREAAEDGVFAAIGYAIGKIMR